MLLLFMLIKAKVIRYLRQLIYVMKMLQITNKCINDVIMDAQLRNPAFELNGGVLKIIMFPKLV